MSIIGASDTGEFGPVEPLLDHPVYAVSDLDAATREFGAATGVELAEGGRHLRLGARNVLHCLIRRPMVRAGVQTLRHCGQTKAGNSPASHGRSPIKMPLPEGRVALGDVEALHGDPVP